MRWFIFLSTFVISQGKYYQYPDGIIPISTSSSHYNFLNASDFFKVGTSKAEIIERVGRSTFYHGFIFNEDGEVQKVITKKYANATDLGEMIVSRTSGEHFIERYPINEDNTLFIQFYHDYEDLGKDKIRGNCLLSLENIRKDPKKLCDDIPRCIGFIERYCLVSSVGRLEKLRILKTGEKYFEKKRTHDILQFVSENVYIYVLLLVIPIAIMKVIRL